MTRYQPLWLQSGSYAASVDRRLLAAIWPTARSVGAAVTPTGAGMGVQAAPGQVAVPVANGTGTVLCAWDAPETVTLDPAGAAARVDLVVCQAYGNDLDGGVRDEFVVTFVKGTEGAGPPAQPANSVTLAQVAVGAGAASIVAGNITDTRPGYLAVPDKWGDWAAPRGYVTGYTKLPASALSAAGSVSGPVLTVPMLAKRRYRITQTMRGGTSAAGACSIRVQVDGDAANAPPGWAPYQMVDERVNAAAEALSGGSTSLYDCTVAGNHTFQFFVVGGGTVSITQQSCSAMAEDIGGY